jgi:hypothetical protein
VTYRFSACPGCGGKLRTDAEQRTQHAEPPCTWFVHVDAEAAAIVGVSRCRFNCTQRPLCEYCSRCEAAAAEALELAELVARPGS